MIKKPSIGRPWVVAGVLAVGLVAMGVHSATSPSRVNLVSDGTIAGSGDSGGPAATSSTSSASDGPDSIEDGYTVPSSASDQTADLKYAAKIGKEFIVEGGTIVNYIPLKEICRTGFDDLSGGSPLNGPLPEYTREAFVTACVAELKARGITGKDKDPNEPAPDRGGVSGDPNEPGTFDDPSQGGFTTYPTPSPQAHGSTTIDRSGQEEPGQAGGSASIDRSGQEEPGEAGGSTTPDRSGQEETGDGGTPSPQPDGDGSIAPAPAPEQPSDDPSDPPSDTQPSDDQGGSDGGGIVG